MDRCLDDAKCGPTWLRRAEIAQIVVNALRHAAGPMDYFDLHAFVVMPNHVHTLLDPRVDPSKFLHSVKGFSSLGRSRMTVPAETLVRFQTRGTTQIRR